MSRAIPSWFFFHVIEKMRYMILNQQVMVVDSLSEKKLAYQYFKKRKKKEEKREVFKGRLINWPES